MASIPDNDLPLAADFEKAAAEAKAAEQESFTVELPWRAGFIIAWALRAYAGPEAPIRCFVCDQARTSTLDLAADHVADEIHRLSYVLMAIEEIVAEKTGREPPSATRVTEERIRSEVRAGRFGRQRRIEVSDELRAIVKETRKPEESA
jgi:hypothetical protein